MWVSTHQQDQYNRTIQALHNVTTKNHVCLCVLMYAAALETLQSTPRWRIFPVFTTTHSANTVNLCQIPLSHQPQVVMSVAT